MWVRVCGVRVRVRVWGEGVSVWGEGVCRV